MKRRFGFAVHVLHWSSEQAMNNALANMELTSSQGRIMGYIARRKTPPCSRDIEEEFRLTHPTVSGLLSRLEKKGFIEFRPDENDRRCKRIYMMPKGMECMEMMHRTILDNEARMVLGFSEEEKELFYSFLGRAIENTGGHPCGRRIKEEERE